MIFLSLAVGYAISINAKYVYYAPHADDRDIYPDCRLEFVESFNETIAKGNNEQVKVLVPYINHTKAQILAEGVEMNLDYTKSWTCYNGRDISCGVCGACLGRLDSFKKLGIADPLAYEC